MNDFESPRPSGPAEQVHLSPERPRNDQPTFLSMVGLVALVVALVILIFFGIGYAFGRVFL